MSSAVSVAPAPPPKLLEGPQDLAINGSPPLFPEPLHVGRPNIGPNGEVLGRMQSMLERRWLSNNGPLVLELEQRLQDRLDVRHCVAMCNGTIALEIAIRALGLTGEVIVPSWSFIATAHALSWQGITPVFADIDPDTHNLDVGSVAACITPATTGIIGVHLWGRPAPVAALQGLADKHGLSLMFDSAHAFDASLGGQRIGGFGRCEVFSFHATKVFNTIEGGAVTTNDDELAGVMRLMRNFGFSGYDNVVHPGTNGKLNEACAAMGLVNLDHLEGFVERNRANYGHYARALAPLDGISLLDYDPADSPNYQYVVALVEARTPDRRDRILAALQAENVLARRYFWPGCHAMKPYREKDAGAASRLPHTCAVADQVIVLPTGDAVGPAEIEQIARIMALADTH